MLNKWGFIDAYNIGLSYKKGEQFVDGAKSEGLDKLYGLSGGGIWINSDKEDYSLVGILIEQAIYGHRHEPFIVGTRLSLVESIFTTEYDIWLHKSEYK